MKIEMKKEYKFTPGHKPWNLGTGGCKKGHDPLLYVAMPSGVYVCLGCKRENGKRYRDKNRKEINLKNRVDRYKLTIEEYEGLFNSQKGHCAICGTKIDRRNLRIDHSHKTGKVRGLLCISCNNGIGMLKDSPDILRNASRYLESHNG